MAEIAKESKQNLVQDKTGTAKKSNFKITKHLMGTYRFGENGIHYVRNTPTVGVYKVRAAHDVRSYTMKAPLMSPIQLNKDYFQVPRQAILPKNWEKLETQPSIGDDVDFDEVGTFVKGDTWAAFLNKINTELATLKSTIGNASETAANRLQAFTEFMKTLSIAEAVFSTGSLLNALGYNAHRLYGRHLAGVIISFDEMLQGMFGQMKTCARLYINIGGEPYKVIMGAFTGVNNTTYTGYEITFHEFLEKWRDGKEIVVTGIQKYDGTYYNSQATETLGYIDLIAIDFKTNSIPWASLQYYTQDGIDLARLWAYQLCVAEFYTNDKVDYVYNAQLYRQYIGNKITDRGLNDTFTLNGLLYEYDYLASYYFKQMLNSYDISTIYDYYLSIFGYKRSLKYKDYFIGAKTRPLAIGNGTEVAVNTGTNTFSVVDVTKSIQTQRFLNTVNKIGRKIEDYVKGLFGVQMKVDYHNPIWIGSTRDIIGTQENENTGEAQMTKPNSVTSVLRSNGSRYEFTCEIDRNSIIIGITNFDIERNYWKGADRFFFHRDRYDWFNPYLQYCGDQDIRGAEYDMANSINVFGYQGAYEEFKQDYNRAFGGFIENLPGWAFLEGQTTDEEDKVSNKQIVISPDLIRSKPSELDKFYVSLTGDTMGNYFHFIIDNFISEEDNLPMAVNPQILN